MAKAKDKSFRSAATGQKVSEEFAKANPETTVGEKKKAKAPAKPKVAEAIETHPVTIHNNEDVPVPVLALGHYYEASVADGPKFYGEAISESAIHPWADGRPVGDPVEIGAAFGIVEIDRETCFDLSNSVHADTFEVSL